MERDFYETILTNFPPKETIEETFYLLEQIEENFVKDFKNLIEKTKEEIYKNENENEEKKENSNGKIHLEINLNKNKEQHYFQEIFLLIGDDYNNPIEPFLPKDILNDDSFFCFEIICNNEEYAKDIIDKINMNILPKINSFPYYISFSKVGGKVKFLQIKNKIVICFSRNATSIKKVIELINDLNFGKKFGINGKIIFSNALNTNKLKNLPIQGYIDVLFSMKFIFDFQIKNFKKVILSLIKCLKNETNFDFLKKIINFIGLFVYVHNLNFVFEYNPKTQDIIDFLINFYFRAPCLMKEAFENWKDEREAFGNIFNIIGSLCSKVGINFNKSNFEILNFYWFFPKNKILFKWKSETK